MSETPEKKLSSTVSTVLIVLGSVLCAIGLLHVVTTPVVIATGDGPSIAGKVVGVILFVGLGVWTLVVGVKNRR